MSIFGKTIYQVTALVKRPAVDRTLRIFHILVLLMAQIATVTPQRAAALGETPAQVFFLSMPEEQVRTAFVAIDGGSGSIGSTMVSITSLAVTVNGTILYYDQWEDGYEAASTTPVQASTLVFGDGNTANGNACTYAATLCTNDVLTAGAVLALRNNVPSNPRGITTTFDAHDKVAATQVVAVTRALWDANTGTVLAGALQVYDTTGYGTDFRLPVGENFSDTATGTTQTLTLYPTSDVSVGSWAEGAAGADADTYGYNEIDETMADDDTTYIVSSGTNEYQAGAANPTVPADATNISVSIVWRGRDTSNNTQRTNSLLRVNGTYYIAANNYNLQNNNYADYTDTWTTNPATSSAWTPATVNTINGLAFDTNNTNAHRITRGYIQITYDLPATGIYDNQMFEYDSVFAMAAYDGTTVSIDSDGNGTTDYTASLDAGEAYMLNGATTGVTLNSNAHITSNLAIQVNMITGDIDTTNKYENRWFNIPPLSLLGSSYVTAVGSPNTDAPSNVFIYNPSQTTAITVNYQTSGGGTGSFAVAPGGTYRYLMPVNSGARFYDSGPFLAIGTVDSSSAAAGGDDGRTWDWGYTLIAEELLAPSLAVGWAPGDNLLPPTSNGSPVWVSPNAATTIYVDYDGNPATGANVDVNGNHYDTSYAMSALESRRIFDPDNDNTGMRVYTVDGTFLAAAWGEDPATAGPGNPYLDMGYVVFPLPQMVVTKDGVLDVTATSPDNQANAGDVIHYTLKAINNGTRTLTNVTITDPKLGALACTPAQPATLVSGASMTCTGSYTLTQADVDAGVVYNTATGDSNQTQPIPVQEEVKIPKLGVTKTADPTSVPETGGSVTFTFTVKNNNSVASGVALTLKSLTDSVFGTLAGDADCKVGTVLAPEAECQFSITRTIAGDAESGSDHVNLFTTIAQDSSGTGVSASNDAAVSFTDVDPAIDVEKYVSIDGGLTWEDTDTAPGPYLGSSTAPQFKFVVTNTGPVALTNVDLVDDVLGNISLDGALAAGASAEYIVASPWAAGQHTNTVLVSGSMTDGAGNVETATDTDQANYFGAVPEMSLTKRANPATYDTVGQIISYSYVVTNSGNITINGPFTVADDKAIDEFCPATSSLLPGESLTCTASYTITQADLDASMVTNKATATNGTVTTNEATVTIYAVAHPNLALVKTASPASYDHVGQTISYSYEFTNIGNVALKPPYAVTDDKATVTCPQTPDPLPVGSSITCTATYAVTQADLDTGAVTNHATATATFGGKPVTSNETEATVNAEQEPALSIDKTALESTYAAVGTVIHYSYLVTNAGNVTLHDPITVSDNKTIATCPALPAGGLIPGATITCSATYTIQQSDLDAGALTNVASATSGTTTSPTDTVTVTATQRPALALDKTASPNTYAAAGESINYNYALTNAGNVTLSGPFTVTDDKATVTCDPGVTSLAVGGTLNCTASHTVTQAEVDFGSITNVATATATFGGNPVTSAPDSETVTANKQPALTIVKTADPTTYDRAGDVISYSYLVTNSGNVTLYNLSVVDDKATDESCPDTSSGLAPQGQITCTASYTITQADMDGGSVTNSAYATDGTTNSAPDTETVNAHQQGGLGLRKSATPGTYASVGDVITYTYVVQNTGNITLAGPFTVNDDKVGMVSCPADSLAPDETVNCTAIYTITQADLDAGSLTNTATATDGALTTNPATATVTAVQTRTLALDKTAQEFAIVHAGDTVHYRYLVTNTGNVTLHDPLTISDDKAEDESCPALPSGGLAPGESLTCTATYTVQQSDLDAGSLTNVASAASGVITSPTDTVTIPATQSPALTLKKSANPLTYTTVGQTITYDYLLTNSGNVTLSGPFTVSDNQASVTCPAEVTSLTPGGTLNCTASYTITQPDLDSGSVTNVATATAKFGETPVTSNQDMAIVTAVQAPDLKLVKSASPSTYDAVGQTISYTYVLKNSGNVTLAGPFTVGDDQVSVTCPAVATLAVGAELTCTATYAIKQADLDAGALTNVAKAKGAFDGEDIFSNEDSQTVNAIPQPALALAKSADPLQYDHVGQSIAYSYVLKNIGNVTLVGPFAVSDDKATVTCPSAATLAVDATLTCNATYAITQADLDSGSVMNIATGHAQTLGGTPVNSNNASATVTAKQNPALSLVKSAVPATYDSVGDVISYSYLVTNSGNVTLHEAITVSDNKSTDEACSALPAGGLAPGESITCTASYTITQTDLDAGSVTNIASATSGATTSPTDEETVTAEKKPALSLVKTASPLSYDTVDELITYTFAIKNTGNITLAGPFTVVDDKLGTLTDCALGPLAPGATVNCTAPYAITQADLDAGSITNIATASGNGVTSGESSATVTAHQRPALSLEKSASPITYDLVGDSITYTFAITNTGNITLAGPFTVVDDKLGTLADCVTGPLAPGATVNCFASHTITQDDLDVGSITNRATASGNGVNSNPSTATVTANQHPLLAVEKSSTTIAITAADQVVPYTFVVTNPGNVTLTGIAVSDPNCDAAPVYQSGDTNSDSKLQVTETWTYTCNHTVTQAEIDAGGNLSNTVTASSTESAPATARLDIPITQSPAILVVKASTTTLIAVAGETVPYTFTVTNAGNVTLTGITVSDSNCNAAPTYVAGDTNADGKLQTTESWTYTCNHTVTQAEVDSQGGGDGDLDNTVIADSSESAPDTDSLAIPITYNPMLTVEKSSTTISLSAPATVTYSYLVTNTGNVTLTGISLSDNNDNNDMTCPAATLAVGASMTCTATHTFTQAELDAGGTLDNTVTTDSDETGPVTDNLSIPIVQSPAMTVEKSSATSSLSAPATVTYNYLVTNTGNVTLTGINLVDNNDNNDLICPAATLAVGAHMTCAATHTFTQAELDAGGSPTAGSGVLYNLVTADSAQTSPVIDSLSIPITQTPAIIVVKASTTVKIAMAGEVVPYTFTVTNPGNVTLTDITVSDSNCNTAPTFVSGDSNSDSKLQTSETWIFTCDHTVTQAEVDSKGGGDGDLDNTVMADSKESAPDTDSLAIPITYNPVLAVEKSSATSELSAPATVTYDYVVTNIGNVTLTGITLSDNNDNDDVVCEATTLVVGSHMHCTATHTFTQSELDAGGTLDNTVTADSNESASVTDDLSIPISQNPALALTKADDLNPAKYDHAGQVVTYTLTATNTGNITLHNVIVVDNPALEDFICTPTSGSELAPAASMVCTGKHSITLADLDAGSFTDTASAASAEANAPEAMDTIHAQQNPSIDLEKYVKNGSGVWKEADIPGVYLNAGIDPQYKLVVTNTGNVTLSDLDLADDTLALTGCSIPTSLVPAASFECLVTGEWAADQHTNIATATGYSGGDQYHDTDVANYLGVVPLVSKTANGHYSEVHDWQVYKSVSTTSQNKFAGETANFTWTVRVDETTHGEDYLVEGVITVVNPNPDDPMVMELTDTLDDGTVVTISSCTGGIWAAPNLTVPPATTAECSYSVVPQGNMDAFNAALPSQVTINSHNPGPESYWLTTVSGDGALDGTYEAWCADIDHTMYPDTNYTANVYSSYETLPVGLIEFSQNLDLVNWVINQDFVGKPSVYGNYTYGDVQRAIWMLIEDNPFANTNGLGAYNQSRVDLIQDAARLQGEDFKPTCGDFVAVILQPVNGSQLITIAQVTFASLGINCAESNAVTAVLNGNTFPASATILWTTAIVNPTVTLADNQNPAFPKDVSGDETFTYSDTYACPADPAAYINGVKTYTESNTAILTGVELNKQALATTAVTCYAPVVTKTAAGTYTERHEWEVDKTVTPASQDVFAGDTADIDWTVAVTENVFEQGFAVTGSISVKNVRTDAVMPVVLADRLDDGTIATISGCTGGDWNAVNQTVTVPANSTAVCAYTAAPTGRSATLNTVTASLNALTTSTTAAVGWTASVIRGSATLTDDQNSAFPLEITESGTYPYSTSYVCSSDPAAYTDGVYQHEIENIAKVTSGDLRDSSQASTVVNCYAPVVSKTAAGTYDERHEWGLTKTVDPVSQSAFAGDTVSYEWMVVVDEQAFEEHFKVAGEITVVNPAPLEMTVDLTDSLGGGTAAVISTCTGGAYLSGQLTIPANTTATCAYTAEPANRLDAANNVAATLNDIAFTASTPFAWTANVIRASATVTDEQLGLNATITDSQTFSGSEQYTCSTDKTAYDPSTYQYTFGESNTATLTSGDFTASRTAATTVSCYVPAISKTADGTYNEVHDWSIAKTVAPTSQSAFAGETKNFTWTVTVSHSQHDENVLVTGQITVTNPNPEDVLNVTLNDVLSDGSEANITGCTGGTWSSPNLTVPANSTAICDYSVVPDGRYNLVALAAALPDTVTMSVSYPYAGGPAYFPVTTVTNGGHLNGTYEGWCVDTDHTINQGQNYTANVYSSYESLPAGLVGRPENFDLVNWVINQDFVGQPADGGLGNYTYSDVQYAIWTLIETTSSTSGLYDLSYARAAQIVSLAHASGENFMPTCGDMVAVVLQPVGGASQTITIAQVTFASLGVDCAKTNVATAVLNGISFPASKLITWTANPINPTATLTDEQGPLNATLSGGKIFTIPDSYTCSTEAGAYTNGFYAHPESNTATLSTVAEPATADTQVACYLPQIDITKTTNGGDGLTFLIGTPLTWQYVVQNTGAITLTGVGVTDNKLGAITCPKTTLAANESMTCTATGTSVAGDYSNTGSVTGTATIGSTTRSATASDASSYFGAAPHISLTKSVAEANFDAAGDVLNYTLVATNDGNVPLSNVSISDPQLGALTCTPVQPATLAPTETLTCAGAYTTFQADVDAGKFDNTASTTGTYSGNPYIATASASVPAVQSPSISIEKASSLDLTVVAPSDRADAGDKVLYTFTVTNTGNVTLHGVTVTDAKADVNCTIDTMAPAAVDTTTCSGSYILTQSDIDAGNVYNHAFVNGTGPQDQDVNADDENDQPIPQTPSVVLVKSVTSFGPYDSVGDDITYSLVATNTGNVTLTDVSISDPLLGALTCAQPATLAPAATLTCTGSYTVGQADLDAGKVDNTATVTSKFGDQDYTDADSQTVPMTQLPAISLVKSASPTTYSAVSQVISYSYVVKNIGNVTLSGPFSISDDKLGALSCPVGGLTPSASVTCTGGITIQQSDLDNGSITNTASAATTYKGAEVKSNEATVTVTAIQNPALSLTKSASPTTYDAVGQIITYTYVMQNTGNVTLSGPFTITDDKLGIFSCATATSLAPNSSLTCSKTASTTQADLDAGSIINHAIATANFHTATVTSNEATATVTAVQSPSITLVKKTNGQDANTAPGPFIPVGGAVTWTYDVANTGNVTLNTVAVADNKGVVVTCPNTSLAPLATMQCTGAGTALAGQYTNLGTATAKSPLGFNVTATDPSNYYGVRDLVVSKTANPTFTRQFSWGISKSVDKTLVRQVGGSVTFNYAVSVAETGFVDSLWKVTGQITVTNPNTVLAITGVNITDAVNNGGVCSVTGGSNVTIPANSFKTFTYVCTYASKPTTYNGVNTATATWDKNANFTPSGSASGTKAFVFGVCTLAVNCTCVGNPTNVHKTVTVTDTFNGITTTLGTVTATTTLPYTSKTFSYSRSIAVPTVSTPKAASTLLSSTAPNCGTGTCKSYTNVAKIVQTGQTASKTVTVCGPMKTGALTIGYWQNTNGQGIIKRTATVGGVCKLTPWLRQFAPFQDLSTSASCSSAATYVYNVIKAANASGSSMNAMLKAQMLATALDVYYSNPALGGNKIGASAPIGGLTVDLTWVKAGSLYQNVSAAFGGATSMTVAQMLTYAASKSNAGGSMWYGNVKATQELAKNAFDAINNQWVFAP